MLVDFSNFEIRRNSSSRIRAMVVVATQCRRTHQTRASPLISVQLFQKLGG